MKLLKIACIAEPIELRMNEAFWEVLPASLAEKRKMKLLRVGGALVSVTPKSKSLQRNRVLGLGVFEPATEDMIDEIMGHYLAARITRFSFHVSPCLQSEALTDWLRARGIKYHHSYAKLFRPLRPTGPVSTDMEVREVGKAGANAFVEVFGSIFAWPDDRRAWTAATFGCPGFSHFMAFNRARPVATGLLYTNGNSAWMGWAGTLTKFRHCGAHTALIRARVKRAAELGAKWVVCETLEPIPGRPSGSYRNLIRQGFDVGYLRPIWAWEKR